jgi:hypothetical protein
LGLADRRAVLRRAGGGDAARGVSGRRHRQGVASWRWVPGLDARDARASDAPSPISGVVRRLFRLRAEPCVSGDAPADLPVDLRPGPPCWPPRRLR